MQWGQLALKKIVSVPCCHFCSCLGDIAIRGALDLHLPPFRAVPWRGGWRAETVHSRPYLPQKANSGQNSSYSVEGKCRCSLGSYLVSSFCVPSLESWQHSRDNRYLSNPPIPVQSGVNRGAPNKLSCLPTQLFHQSSFQYPLCNISNKPCFNFFHKLYYIFVYFFLTKISQI